MSATVAERELAAIRAVLATLVALVPAEARSKLPL